jgi:DNA-3-methyladenine glycosylase II
MTRSLDRWGEGRTLLRAADPRMGLLVDVEPTLDPDVLSAGRPDDLWGALVRYVIGQQISLSAARAIYDRLAALTGNRMPEPAELAALDEPVLRAAGLSRAKVAYLHDLAARVLDGRLDAARLAALDDDAARLELMQVKGVGRFTADGVLLLALHRADVWPAADLALRRAVELVWELAPGASIAEVDAIGEPFRPWRTLAAAYCYRAAAAASRAGPP